MDLQPSGSWPLFLFDSSTDAKTEEIFKIPAVLGNAGDQYKYYLNTLRFKSSRLDPVLTILARPPGQIESVKTHANPIDVPAHLPLCPEATPV